jgi:hypothetical protein
VIPESVFVVSDVVVASFDPEVLLFCGKSITNPSVASEFPAEVDGRLLSSPSGNISRGQSDSEHGSV